MMGAVSLTPIFVIGGIGVVVSVFEHMAGKESKVMPLVGMAASLIGFGIVIYLAIEVLNEAVTTFMNLGGRLMP
jgi:hypothetical protein